MSAQICVETPSRHGSSLTIVADTTTVKTATLLQLVAIPFAFPESTALTDPAGDAVAGGGHHFKHCSIELTGGSAHPHMWTLPSVIGVTVLHWTSPQTYSVLAAPYSVGLRWSDRGCCVCWLGACLPTMSLKGVLQSGPTLMPAIDHCDAELLKHVLVCNTSLGNTLTCCEAGANEK